MLDIGMMEIFVIGALALIVVGPKELPGLLRTVGQFAAKARGMAREFQRTMEEAAREADLDDVAKAVKSGGKNKLPFDNQVVDSLKEFQNSVKGELNEATRAVKAADAPKPAAPAAAPKPVEAAGEAKPAVAAKPAETPAPAPAAPAPAPDAEKSA